MATALERRLDRLVHEINEIKKDLIMEKMQRRKKATEKKNRWKSLGLRISQRWDNVSALDEIRQQREKG